MGDGRRVRALLADGRGCQHGRSGLRRYLTGSVAERVLRLSPVPVLTARLQPDERLAFPYDDILVPTDGSTAAMRAARHALALASELGASVHALSVVDDTALGLTEADRVALAQEAGVALRTGQEGVVRLQSQLGFAEERIAQAESRIETEITSLGIARNDLLSVDVAESASALEQVQSQLELLYTITARSSRLNLANFLS